jgi:hypothetical protein
LKSQIASALRPAASLLIIMLEIGAPIIILLYLLGFVTNWLLDRQKLFAYLDSGSSLLGRLQLGFEAVSVLAIIAGVLMLLYRAGKQLTK